jgi:hypothetical protein
LCLRWISMMREGIGTSDRGETTFVRRHFRTTNETIKKLETLGDRQTLPLAGNWWVLHPMTARSNAGPEAILNSSKEFPSLGSSLSLKDISKMHLPKVLHPYRRPFMRCCTLRWPLTQAPFHETLENNLHSKPTQT